LISLPLSALVGAISWYSLEKPALKLRVYFEPIENDAIKIYQLGMSKFKMRVQNSEAE